MRKNMRLGIEDPVVVKDRTLFFLCDRCGNVLPAAERGLGLFFHDCRYLRRYELELVDDGTMPLMASAGHGGTAIIELTNEGSENEIKPLRKHGLAITWERAIVADEMALFDTFGIRNCTPESIELSLLLRFEAAFEDVFELRGMSPKRRGTLHPPHREDGLLRFGYRGADDIFRGLDISYPEGTGGDGAVLRFELLLGPQETRVIPLRLGVLETRAPRLAKWPPPRSGRLTPPGGAENRRRARVVGLPGLDSDDRRLNEVFRRSVDDLRLLASEHDHMRHLAAGVPWFVAMFGRDTLFPSIQLLAFDRDVAADTLRILARYQGRGHDPRRYEQPGKIMHELRVGEMAHLGEIPQTPSYSSIDSTPLFLILLAKHAEWSGTIRLFRELRDAVEGALAWMDTDGDPNHDGYIEYGGTGKHPAPQGWKDSADAIVHKDGSLAEGPIALVEVQGYAYLAKRSAAGLYRIAGETRTADRLELEAAALRQRFNRDFWMEEAGCYCLALAAGRRVAVVSSNPGHLLWAGIADPEKARRTAERLMQPDMFSGWGIRTLCDRELRYNPVGYHLGSVWPFDNSIILAGLRVYGLDDTALRVFAGIVEAAAEFELYRLPEFFCGHSRVEGAAPVRAPRAEPLQAWSSGAIPFMLSSLLGLQPDGFDNRLRIVRPVLPAGTSCLTLRGLRVGQAVVDLGFERSSAPYAAVRVLRQCGKLQVTVE